MDTDGLTTTGPFITDSSRLEQVQKRTYRVRLVAGERLCLSGKFRVALDVAHSHPLGQLFFNNFKTPAELWTQPVPIDAPPWQSAPVWHLEAEHVQLRIMDESGDFSPWPLRLSPGATAQGRETAQTARSRLVAPPLQYRSAELEEIVEALRKETTPVVLVCGPRKSGKSTLVSLLSFLGWPQFGQPLVLELDVGQNLFLAPGYVSLHEVKELVWPIWKASMERLESIYCGFVTPLSDPLLYLSAVECLWRACQPYRGRRWILVNTLGWTQGYGRSLLEALIKTVQPSIIIRLEDTVASTERLSWLNDISVTASTHSCSVLQLTTTLKPRGTRPTLSPAHLRASQILHELLGQNEDGRPHGAFVDYFRWVLWMHRPAFPIVQLLCSVAPWCVPLDTFSVIFLLGTSGIRRLRPAADRETLHRILNGSIVALCIAADQLESAMPERWLLQSPGLALVRSIDTDNGLLYIISSLPGSVLERTVALATSPNVQLPAAALQLGGMQAEPYLGLTCAGAAVEPASDRTSGSRKNLLRRRLTPASMKGS